MTQEQYNELLRSQQGELNAVLMYQRLPESPCSSVTINELHFFILSFFHFSLARGQ